MKKIPNLCSMVGFLTARRRGSKKTFDGTLLLHYEKSCQNAFEQCLNLFKPPKTFKCPFKAVASAGPSPLLKVQKEFAWCLHKFKPY